MVGGEAVPEDLDGLAGGIEGDVVLPGAVVDEVAPGPEGGDPIGDPFFSLWGMGGEEASELLELVMDLPFEALDVGVGFILRHGSFLLFSFGFSV